MKQPKKSYGVLEALFVPSGACRGELLGTDRAVAGEIKPRAPRFAGKWHFQARSWEKLKAAAQRGG